MMGRRLPETCRIVIQIKLEFSTSVGFIRKETLFSYSAQFLEECAEISITFQLLGFLSSISRITNTNPSAAMGSIIPVLEIWIPARGNLNADIWNV
jgi:hypothetical protein